MPVNANVELQCFRSVKTTPLLAIGDFGWPGYVSQRPMPNCCQHLTVDYTDIQHVADPFVRLPLSGNTAIIISSPLAWVNPLVTGARDLHNTHRGIQ